MTSFRLKLHFLVLLIRNSTSSVWRKEAKNNHELLFWKEPLTSTGCEAQTGDIDWWNQNWLLIIGALSGRMKWDWWMACWTANHVASLFPGVPSGVRQARRATSRSLHLQLQPCPAGLLIGSTSSCLPAIGPPGSSIIAPLGSTCTRSQWIWPIRIWDERRSPTDVMILTFLSFFTSSPPSWVLLCFVEHTHTHTQTRAPSITVHLIDDFFFYSVLRIWLFLSWSF